MHIKNNKKDEFLEYLMARIILAGGGRIEPEKLRVMPLGDVLDIIYPLFIELSSHVVDTIEFDLMEFDS